ncbi:aspartate aminotransferase family protein [Marinivivus vitaminiproducens]|uniref:aspartate aminotransferase family protein n=1 Tax=Marinivivus vitaminiproducens TaxID=3035935 RepID=UPI00279D5CB8|nr:aminotransferase class III-fold pyridoxal phosphate-dependent enzyme [Geminicoccaceae bacterium SCSIO 64248]
MLETAPTNSAVLAAYRERTPGSAELTKQARAVLPSGIAHDSRHLLPYGVFIERAEGSRKWDVDGNLYVDYFGGHGALLLGHNHPAVMQAAAEAMAKGTHFGANHPLEVRWAELVQAMIPSAERVRFTSSGTEATHLAVRVARAHSGKRKILRFKTHFHGWHDHMTTGYSSHFDGSPTPGVLKEVADGVVLAAPTIEAFRHALETDDDIAAVLVEPTGSSFGMVPLKRDFLQALREMTAARGVILLFDEVISGFRVSPGGAQAAFGITPDLTTLAKIVAGGLPGGAVAGRKDIMDRLDFFAAEQEGFEKIDHPGTFNGNPVSAAAGIAALDVIRTTDACERANAYAAKLRDALNGVLAERKVAWAVYGAFSDFHIFTNPGALAVDPRAFDPHALPYDVLKSKPMDLTHKLRLAMLAGGVDISGWPGGLTSAAHDEADLALTVDAFDKALHLLRQDGEV